MERANKKYKQILETRPEMMISKSLDRDLTAFLKKVKGM